MNEQNLIPFNRRTENEQRALARRGGIASGRARRAKAGLLEKLRCLMECRIDDGEGGLARCDELIAENLVMQALSGDLAAAKLILEHLEGKPRQQFEHDVTGAGDAVPREIVINLVRPDGTRRTAGSRED